ncbi:helix-hairpin-helix domain-containing protein [Paenactinomyces guangxiensis]|uniref:Helix-hairpin-helix domain-containing protein n=1 Tax=Paenactinomyces guangxiensis TaxID=1490290 RepID=A0A7W2A7F2_9BACL|nr:helix-hairpin-helix domain-containing protein [Paenactinomyces guangxiensis]MBA4493082.1 helix-hairpin-helix domain-containing protein [Paenactinomyces guangxiensis]MBH8590068.1 helix-hairpin-helix domain-containing protein [Paenactinomyces guangxiensis]
MVRIEWTLREKVLAVALGVCMVLLAFSFLGDDGNSAEQAEPSLQPYQPLAKEKKVSGSGSPAISKKAPRLIVDVKGAVNNPGIYELAATARVYEAIQKAGGANQSADLNQVNLAQPLADGMVIYVPKKGETVPDIYRTAKASPTAGQDIDSFDKSKNPSAKINVNTATVQELQQLNGVGPSKAEAIVRYREEHGKFQSVDNLTDVPGIGEKTLAKFRDQITVE